VVDVCPAQRCRGLDRVAAGVSIAEMCMGDAALTVQVPSTELLDRFLDAEDLVMGRCKADCMDEAEFQREWKEGGPS